MGVNKSQVYFKDSKTLPLFLVPLEDQIKATHKALNSAVARDPSFRSTCLQTPVSIRHFDQLQSLLENGYGSYTSKPIIDLTEGDRRWSCYNRSKPLTDCLYAQYLPVREVHFDENQLYRSIFDPSLSIAIYLPVFMLAPEQNTESYAEMMRLSPEELLTLLKEEEIDLATLRTYLSRFAQGSGKLRQYIESLTSLFYASTLYQNIPDAQVELAITETNLSSYHWSKNVAALRGRKRPTDFDHAWSYACIASFETGYLNITPSELRIVVGISVGNSLYVTERLCSSL